MDWPLLQSRPGSRQGRDSRTNPVQVALNALTHHSNRRSWNITTPLPDFGTDRMWDFEQVGTANLWKSGPFFSTGAKVTRLGMVELRLNLCSRARNTKIASRAREHEEMDSDFDPRLSTAFAKGGGLLPTAIYGSSQT
jgi:hypothetical protein